MKAIRITMYYSVSQEIEVPCDATKDEIRDAVIEAVDNWTCPAADAEWDMTLAEDECGNKYYQEG